MSNPSGWSSPPPVPPPPPTGSNARLRPLNTGDVLDGMFRLTVRHWRVYLPAVAAVVVPTQLVLAVVERDLVSDVGLLEVLSDPEAAQQAATGGPGIVDIGSPLLLGLFVSLLVSPLVTGLAAWIGTRAQLSEPVDAGAALRAGLRRYPALVGVNLLTWLALAAAVALVAVPLVGLSIATGVGGFGVVLLGIPALLVLAAALAVVSALVLVAPVLVVVEGKGPIAALARSVRLVRSRFWGVLGIGLLAWVVSGLVGMVLTWPFSLPAILLGGSPALFFTTAGALVAGIVAAPLMPNARALLYVDLRIRAEGLDLEAMADAVASPGSLAPPSAGGSPV